jgi:predicted acylesterase/phospholipase RssA
MKENESRVRSSAKPLFAIFEGGGAKGIAHVGAYAAVDEMGYELIGVAGASAGAIVAALIAVGLKPKEIFNPAAEGENIFTRHQLSPTRALGEQSWGEFQRLRKIWVWIWIPILVLLVSTFAVRFAGWPFMARALGLSTLVLVLASLFRGWRLWNQRGIFDPAHFEKHFNEVLRVHVVSVYQSVGMSPESVPQKIRFRDIDPRVVSVFCRLKIVATDIAGQQLRLFDHRTPDVVVSEAVAASIAIPGLFKPAAIPSFCDRQNVALSRYYADGGLVSNLPVWCFSEEKAAAERRQPNSAAIPIVAFTLSDTGLPTAADVVLKPVRYFRHVFQSAVFGGQTVVQEFVPDLYPILLPTSLGVLSFDVTWAEARAAHDEAKREASATLRQRLIFEPEEWQVVLAIACAEIQATITAHVPALKGKDLGLRAALFEPNRPQRRSRTEDTFITAYKITRSYNMELDADDRLTLDSECTGVPEAFEQRQPVFWAPGDTASRGSVMTKYEHALVRRSVKCALCVPIFSNNEVWNLPSKSRNQPLAVIALDTDEDILEYVNHVPLDLIVEATLGISALLTERRSEVR